MNRPDDRDDERTRITWEKERKKKPQREMTQLYAPGKRPRIPTVAERDRRESGFYLYDTPRA